MTVNYDSFSTEIFTINKKIVRTVPLLRSKAEKGKNIYNFDIMPV